MILAGEIRDVPGSQNSLAIKSLARYPVEEHNKKENSLLEFERVISAKHQALARSMKYTTMHYITLEAKDGVNKKNSLLKFERVISAKHQIVVRSRHYNTMHYITLEAKDGVNKKFYEAMNWEMSWIYYKEMQEFRLVKDASAESSV